MSKLVKIVYLHGLESGPNGSKVGYLKNLGCNVLHPPMKYRDEDCFEKTLDLIKWYKPDFIVGSSMGGYFAYLYGKHLKLPVLLLNPALHSRSFEPKVVLPENDRDSKVYLITGKNDDVIDPKRTVKWLNENDKWDWNPNNHYSFDHGHRTPIMSLVYFFMTHSYFANKILNV